MAEPLVKVTLRELIGFLNEAGQYLKRFPAPTNLSYALSKMTKRGLKETEKMDEAVEDARRDNALTDEKSSALLREEINPNIFKFDKKGLKAVMDKNKEWLEKTVSVEPYWATEVPKDLANNFRVAFEGFVIRPGPPEEKAEPEIPPAELTQAAPEA